MTELYLLKTSEFEIDSKKLYQFPKERQERIQNAIKKEKAQQLYAACLLLNYGLKKHGKNIKDVKINAYGKPYLDESLFFNLSHSQSYVALVIDEKEVGIDLQEKNKISNQAAQLFLGQSFQNPSYVWTRKEAFLKCLGCGWKNKDAIKKDVLSQELIYANTFYFFEDLPLLDAYHLSICSKRKLENITVKEVSKNELISNEF